MEKIIIFTSTGGGGHISVTNALDAYLNDTYEIKQIHIFSEVLGPIDPIQILSFYRYTGEEFYNYFVRKKWFWLLNLMYWIGKRYFHASSKRTERLLATHLKKHTPDMVISVVPLVNNEILASAKTFDIPCLVTPTDLDATMFIHGFKEPNYRRFRFVLGFDDALIRKTIEPAAIPAHQVVVTGFPVRPNFFENENKIIIKKNFAVPENKPVILLLMGALGSKETYTFSQQLAQLTTPAHILICLGKNESLRKKIEQITFPPHITATIIGFTEHISDLLTISDLFITKSGSVSFCEGIYMNVPMLLDATSLVLLWERFNHTFVKRHGFGDIITRRGDLPQMVDYLLVENNKLATMKKNLESFEKKQGDKEFRQLVKQMLQEPHASQHDDLVFAPHAHR